uniref:Kelch like family member 10 n=1 Tax=Gouania willdenowi TaxID=441366 RepID=A0A8C5DNH6_GOUWI
MEVHQFNVKSLEQICFDSRYLMSVTVLKGYIYAMGGYRDDDIISHRTAERYQPDINQWTFIASMNEERISASCTTLNNKIYICGGWNNYRVLNTAEYYNPDTNQWTLITPMGTPRYDLGVVAYMGHIFAVGGSDGFRYLRSAEAYDPSHLLVSDTLKVMSQPSLLCSESGINNTLFCRRLPNAILMMVRIFSKTIEAFDYRTNSWITVQTNPSLEDSMTHLDLYSIVFLGRCFYIVGSGLRMTDPSNRVWRFNLDTHTWQEMSPMQESQNFVSVTVLKGYIYAMGGFRDDGTSLRTAERYQPNINQWTFIASMNEERIYASCTTLNNKIYICGGCSLCVSIKVFKDIRRTNV